MAYIHIENMQKRIGDFNLGPISLSLEKGDYIVLLGPTGSGKTSLLKCITGYVGKTEGIMQIENTDLNKISLNKRNIGYVTQKTDLFPHLTVKENIAFGLQYFSIPHKEHTYRIKTYLKKFELTHLKNRLPYTLSGGESKKTAIARSLITEPKLLLLDEPLSMLDHNSRMSLIETLSMIHKELKTTTIHVTHDRHEAWSIAQKCSVISGGTIMQAGSVSEVFRNPKNYFVASFLGCRNIFKARFEKNIAILEWGKTTLSYAPDFESGWVVIRPEHITLVDKNNSYKTKGIVQAVHDFGTFIEIAICVEGNHCIIVHSFYEHAKEIKKDDEVFLNWQEESVHSFFK